MPPRKMVVWKMTSKYESLSLAIQMLAHAYSRHHFATANSKKVRDRSIFPLFWVQWGFQQFAGCDVPICCLTSAQKTVIATVVRGAAHLFNRNYSQGSDPVRKCFSTDSWPRRLKNKLKFVARFVNSIALSHVVGPLNHPPAIIRPEIHDHRAYNLRAVHSFFSGLIVPSVRCPGFFFLRIKPGAEKQGAIIYTSCLERDRREANY